MIALFKALSVLPLWLAHGVGWWLGWLVFALSSTYRRRFLENARQAGVGWPDQTRAVGEAGKLAAELPRLWFGAPVALQWVGAEHVQQALDLNRGIVFLTPHLGCFEMAAQGYARRFGQDQRPMTVLFRPARQRWLRALVANARARPGLRTAAATLGGVKQMLKALRAGECVGLLPDQVPPQGLGLWLRFFGRDAYTMTLSARLAQQSGAALLLAWGERLSWGRGYRVHVRPMPMPLAAQLDRAVLQVNQAMEELIRACPGQYLWGYARYKQPRQDA